MRKELVLSIIALLAACSNEHGTTAVDGNIAGDGNIGDGNGGDGATPTTIAVTLNNRPTTAATFGFVAAYQDGVAAWQDVPAPTGDVYTFTVTSSAWSFAWTCITAGAATREVNIYDFTVAERTSLTIDVPARCSDRTATAVGVSGTISNPPTLGNLSVGFARTMVGASGTTSKTYSMQTVPATHDLITGHSATNINGDVVIDQAAVQRGLVVSGATTTANVNFSNAQNTQTATVTATTTAGQTPVVSTTLYSAGGTVFTFVRQGAGASFTSTSLAGALALTGDVYDQRIEIDTSGATAAVESWVSSVANQTYNAPIALGTVTSTVPSQMPYPMIKTTWGKYAGSVGYNWVATQGLTGTACGAGGGNCSVLWATVVSPGYVGSSPQLLMPDLSGLTGWDPKLQMQSGANVTGSVVAATSSAGQADFPSVNPAAAGTQRTFVSSNWTATP